MEDLKIIIAANLTMLRKDAGLSQLEVAEKFGYTDKAVSKWERGESIPDIATLKKIAVYYGVTVDFLLEETHKRKSRIKVNKGVIICLSVMLVWLIATLVFVIFRSADMELFWSWMTFVYAVPVALVVLLVMNSSMGRPRLNYLIISLLIWSVLLCIYLTLLPIGHYWILFVLGIPAEIIVLLWMKLKKRV